MIYLDNSATTFPKPESVIEAMSEFMRTTCANPGRSAHKMAQETNREILMARMELSQMLGVQNPMQTVFTKNASESLNMAINGYVKNGDHVVTSCMEHNSVLRPLHYLQDQGIINLTIVSSDDEGFVHARDIKEAINWETSLVAITHASNLTGSINDIEEISDMIKKENIGRDKNIVLLVDAAQTAGFADIDVTQMGIDMLAGAGHKCLYGPTGTGFLCVSENIKLRPVYRGGTGSMSESLEQPDFMPDMLETGTLNAAGIAGLRAGVKYIDQNQVSKLREKQQKYIARLIREFSGIDGVKLFGTRDASKRAGAVAINIRDRDSQEITHLLSSEYDIATRGGKHCAPLAHKRMGTLEQGMVRISVSSFTTDKDIDSVIQAVRELAKE
ncbi:aminotransferase class V-fold PLP-dependent enzyme [Proteocatella sphenisci]|uniref:aminotransferase class V-fold PLP-dependent enzyme n=1 Tax=Proteocatella sphenisci TaxID=181070 RepID=UPI00049186BB|nr:aminotransferase class V-fold PLP-dependent enzyme [Proteocatella sphenisci]